MLFTLNAGAGPRDAAGRWQPAQARSLLAYAATRGDPVAIWELGNEVNAYGALLHLSLDAATYASDVRTARLLIDQAMPSSALAAPASAFTPLIGEFHPILADVLADAGASLDVVTWHWYPQQSHRCPLTRRAQLETLLDPAVLDETATFAGIVEAARDAGAPQAAVWLGETGNAQCGGEAGISDTFVASLWWLDELGLLARRGQQVIVRQTLSGAAYGLIDDATLEPRPDYYASLLWRRLMGTRILDAHEQAVHPPLRIYASCTRSSAPGFVPGSVTALLINLDTGAATIGFDGVGATADIFVGSAATLDSKELLVNAAPVHSESDGAPPDFVPVHSAAPMLTIPAVSWAFVVLPGAHAKACP